MALPSAGSGIVARGVRRRFGGVEAVRGLDLVARPGEVTALVGPNGAGKTTLLLVLATLLVPDAGEVRVAGHDPVHDPDAVRARTGWAPDAFGLYESLTAREYLELFGQAYRMGRPRARARAGELLELARLHAAADAPVHVLSRGQKQRLGLLRALVHDPQVLLLDEPAAGLDPRSRVELRDLLRGLARQGTCVLVSSHLLGDLEELADAVVLVDAGRTLAQYRIDALPRSVVLRRWRVRALETAPLLASLDRHGYDRDLPGPGGVEVRLPSDEAAADLLAQLVGDGVRVVQCAPLGGALEAAYLDLVEDRR